MAKFVKHFSFVLVLVVLISAICMPISAEAATAKGTISAVTNTASGIKVKWTKDSTKAGYYIYRRTTGSNSFKKVKTIKSASTTSWTDTNVTNGTRYVYRVRSYKGSKITANTAEKSIYRLTSPSITSISSSGVGSIAVKSGTNKKASGYEIKYAKKSDFSDAKTVKCAGTKTVNTTICNLASGTRYYVKIRAYYNASGTLHYSAYSAKKYCTTKTSYTAYTSHLNTSIYAKASSSSTKTSLGYMTKVKVGAVYAVKSSGLWQKVTYNGSNYYVWLTKSASEKFTKTKISTDPTNYTSADYTKYQNDVIKLAVKYANEPTAYAHGESEGKLVNGRYGFDCSGYVSYIMDTVMQKYVPTYHINSGIEAIYKTNAIYNKGTDAEFSVLTVCEKTIDYSKMQPGDVIFWNLSKGTKQTFGWNHCGIYLGNNKFIHATPGVGIVIYPIEGVYMDEFVAVKRYTPTTVKNINQQVQIVRSSEKIFSEKKYDDAYVVTKLSGGTTVTLLFTSVSQNSNPNDNWAYVKYMQSGETKYGYIYNPAERLAQ